MVDLSKTIVLAPAPKNGAARRDVALDLRDLQPRSELKTEMLDWSSARELHAQLLELCAKDPAGPEALRAPNLTTTLRLPSPPAVEPKPDLTQTLVIAPRPAELDSTIYDGGALREYALGLVANADPAPTPAAGTPVSDDLPPLPLERSALGRQLEAWRDAFRALPLPRKLAVALVPLVLAMVASGRLPLSPRTATSVGAIPRSANVPAAPKSAPSSGAGAQAASARALAMKAPVASAALPTGHAPPALARDPLLERAALRAAFDGNQRDAVDAYEKLGARPGGEPFRLAARLVREGQVRKP